MTDSQNSSHGTCAEYFRLLTESVTDIVAIITGDAPVLKYVNPAAERCLGYRTEELIGRNAMELVHPDDRERVQARLDSFTDGPVIPYTYRLRHKDGTWRSVESVARDLRKHPLIGGIIVNTRDVTERLRLERELSQVNRLNGLGRLAAQVAHEFNNVLMGIQPFIGVIRRRTAGDPDVIRITDLMNRAVERGRRITYNILRFSRPSEPSFAVVDVYDLLQAAAEEIRHRITGIRVQIVAPPEPLSITADREQIMQVLINLATNSHDAMIASGGGTLTIEAAAGTLPDTQSFVHLTIADTGEGIAPEDLDLVFEPMFTTKHTGTGLGLSVVQQIVTLHNGRVFAESTPGVGTTMHVFLPRAACEAAGERVGTVAYEAPPLRILIVEDDAMVAAGILAALEAEGADTHHVTTGAEALEAVDVFEPDVVLLDLRLPDADGRAVYDEIATRWPGLPVIFSSGHAMELERVLTNRNVRFLLKPYTTDELMRTILELKSRDAITDCRSPS